MEGFLEITAPWRPKKFDSVEELWGHFKDYIEHTVKTPVVEPKVFSAKEGIRHTTLDRVRPFSKQGFCTYLGISMTTWENYKNTDDKVLVQLLEYIENVIVDQQMQGAMTGLFNVSITSRILGLVDKQEIVQHNTNASVDDLPEEHRAVLIHPDDDQPLNLPRPMYSRAQIEAGIPFVAPPHDDPNYEDQKDQTHEDTAGDT